MRGELWVGLVVVHALPGQTLVSPDALWAQSGSLVALQYLTMACLQRQTELSPSEERQRYARSQKVIRTNAKILGRLHLCYLNCILCHQRGPGSDYSLKLCLSFICSWFLHSLFPLSFVMIWFRWLKCNVWNWLQAQYVYTHLVSVLFSQVWRAIWTSSSSCRVETSSRSALLNGRRPATSNSRRTARPCGRNRRNSSSQTRPVSAVPASHNHVCETRLQHSCMHPPGVVVVTHELLPSIIQCTCVSTCDIS